MTRQLDHGPSQSLIKPPGNLVSQLIKMEIPAFFVDHLMEVDVISNVIRMLIDDGFERIGLNRWRTLKHDFKYH